MEGRYLSRSELAKFLGVSERTIDRRAADGSLPPPVLIGRRRFGGNAITTARAHSNRSSWESPQANVITIRTMTNG